MPAKQGDRIVYPVRVFLNQDDDVPPNEVQSKQFSEGLGRVEEGVRFVDHALLGMKVGGYRNVRVSLLPAYRDKGIPDLIPPGAVLMCKIWLRDIENLSSDEPLSGVVGARILAACPSSPNCVSTQAQGKGLGIGLLSL